MGVSYERGTAVGGVNWQGGLARESEEEVAPLDRRVRRVAHHLAIQGSGFTGVPRSYEKKKHVGPYSSPMPRDLW